MFNWKQYIINYPDLQLAGINTKEGALRHYKLFGKKEGRNDNINNRSIRDRAHNTPRFSPTLVMEKNNE
jgi:hypothetical protein